MRTSEPDRAGSVPAPVTTTPADAPQQPPETGLWTPDGNGYTAAVEGVTWHLAVIRDGVLPAGWCLWNDNGWRPWNDGGKRHTRPVAAEGRPMAFVLEQATLMVSSAWAPRLPAIRHLYM